MIKHSLGEWTIDSGDPLLVYTDFNGVTIAEVLRADEQSVEEAEANAKLIASAPKLLSALVNITAILFESNNRHIWDNGKNALIVADCMEVIKKATAEY